jgi:stage IV sporulation protein FB
VRWSYRIVTLFGTEVRLHITFLALLGWYAFVAWRVGGEAAAAWSVGFLALVFASVLLHEFGHVLMAKRFGIRTPDILLSPIGGLARLERMPEEPRQELLVALAGPAVTLAIVAVLAGTRALGPDSQSLWVFDPGHERLLPALLRANIVLLGFNLIPAFPMDGGRVLRAILSSRIGLVRGTRIAARIGQLFAFGLGLFGLWASPMLVLIAGFIYLAADGEAKAVETRAAGQGMTAAGMMITNLRTLPVYATLSDAIAMLLSGEQREFPIVDNDGRLEGMLTRDHLIRGLAEHGPGATVGTVMATGVEGVPPSLPFDRSLDLLRAGGLSAVPVVTPDRVVIGLITADNVTDLLLVRRHLPVAR